MEKVKVSVVAYTNSLPFVYGLEHGPIVDLIELSKDIPAECARKVQSGEADIGLIPVAALHQFSSYQLVSDHCIGADGAVASVFVFSHKPIEEVKTIRLDEQSRSSNLLTQLLAEKYWNIQPVWLDEPQMETDAFVLIGDRTFDLIGKYAYTYDLAEEWKKYSGLPFVFAAWVAKKPLTDEFLEVFRSALEKGVEKTKDIAADLPAFEADYLLNKISYQLDVSKREALDLFLKLTAPLVNIKKNLAL